MLAKIIVLFALILFGFGFCTGRVSAQEGDNFFLTIRVEAGGVLVEAFVRSPGYLTEEACVADAQGRLADEIVAVKAMIEKAYGADHDVLVWCRDARRGV
jgi:hypothetical protein